MKMHGLLGKISTTIGLLTSVCAGLACGSQQDNGGQAGPVIAQKASALGVSLGVWTPLGPAPMIGGMGDPFPGTQAQVAGAIQAVLPDPTNADVMVIGTANGGIWRAIHARADVVHWDPLTDSLPSLSIRSMARDPANPRFMVAGTGGTSSFNGLSSNPGLVYVTTDGGDSWTVVGDPGGQLVGDTLTGIAARGGVILVASSSRGLFRRTDGGANPGTSWTQITTGTSGMTSVNLGFLYDVITDPSSATGYYLVGSGGLFRSTDSGQSWTRISDNDSVASVLGQPLHLAQALTGSAYARLATGNDGRLVVSVIGNGNTFGGHLWFVGYTTNQGQTWTSMDVPRFPLGPSGSTQAPQGIVSATVATPIVIRTSAPHGLGFPTQVRIRGVAGNPAANGDWLAVAPPTPDGGMPRNDEFALVDLPSGANSVGTGTATPGPTATWQPWNDLNPNGQGGLHTSLAVDPTDSNIVYLGGDAGNGLFQGGAGSAALLRGDARQPIGGVGGPIPPAGWTNLNGSRIPELPGGGTANATSPHSDSRKMVVDAAGDLIQSCDGGIFRRNSPRDNTGDWSSIVGDIQNAEIHDVAFDATFGNVFGGTQDNGETKQVGSGLAWQVLSGGDGGDVAVATVSNPDGGSPLVVAYTSAQNLGGVNGFRRRTFTSATDPGTSVAVGVNIVASDGGTQNLETTNDRPFVTRFVLNPSNSHRMVIGGSSVAYESFDDGDTLTPLQDSTGAPSGGAGSALGAVIEYRMAYGHPSSIGALWIASSLGLFLRAQDGQPLNSVAPPSPGVVFRDVAMAPSDPKAAYLVSATDVYSTSVDAKGTRSWVVITGDLPASRVGQLHVIRYVPSSTGDRLLVGTDSGVYVASIANPTVWSRVGANLPRAIVFDMDYRNNPATGLDRLVIGTMGRGAWSIDNVTTLNQAPRGICRDITVPADATCQATVAAAAIDAGSSDPDGDTLIRAVSVGSGTSGPTVSLGLGPSTVTLTVTDPQGAAASCTAQVTVTDTTPPTIGTAPNVTRTVCSPSFEAVTLSPPTANDNCGTPSVTGQVIASTNPGLRLPFAITGNQAILGPGVHTIRWTASDGSNPGATSTQTITLRPGVYATQSASLRDGAKLQLASGGFAMLMESGSGGVTIGNDARASEVWSGGAMTLGDRDQITGALRSTSTIRLGNQDTIGGPVVQNSPLSFPPPLTVNVTFPSQNQGNVQVFGGQSRSIGPGAYDGVTVFSNGTLTLNGAGQYFMNSLDLEPQGRILLNQSAGAVLINIRNTLIYRGTLSVSAGVIDGFRTAYFGTSLTTLESPYNGIFVAPNASVALGGNTPQTFTGQFFARQLNLVPGDTIICRGD